MMIDVHKTPNDSTDMNAQAEPMASPGDHATLLQTRASNPQTSAWVAASAGSGKTKVLIDRLVRLLLAGAEPGRIVCLTYTNAAAAEMTNRLFLRLNAFATADDKTLRMHLSNLNGSSPQQDEINRARTLLGSVLDAPSGVRIDTIHGFSQMVLQRFPLEAGLAPGFDVADEHTSRTLMSRAIQQLLHADDPETQRVLMHLFQEFPAETVEDSVRELMGLKWRHWLHQLTDVAMPVDNSHAETTPIKALHEWVAKLVACCRESMETDPFIGTCVGLIHHSFDRPEFFEGICALIYTKSGKLRTKTLKSVTASRYPDAAGYVEKISAYVQEIQELIKSRRAAKIAQAYTFLAKRAAKLYTDFKRHDGVLDYDDLIFHTVALFTHKEMAAWVLYKLDGGLDHVLLDEAQDTSHQQWRLITRLLEEFFSGNDADRHRTLFVVGDVKQSIYGFQGADPQGFIANRGRFKQTFLETQQRWLDIPLNISFRSAPAILHAVDQVFADQTVAKQLGDNAKVTHIPFRQHIPGRVEIWPLAQSPEAHDDAFTAWDAPGHPYTEVTESNSVLAEKLAVNIAQWLKEGRWVPAKNRAICPQDIMILVQRRSRFVRKLVNCLRLHKVPVEGEDRYDLKDHPVVVDILNLIEVCCLPENDLALACTLKSPLGQLNDEDLMNMRECQGDSLWSRLHDSSYTQITAWLDELYTHSQAMRPFEFLMHMFHHAGGIDRFKSRFGSNVPTICSDLLGLVEQFEVSEVPTLPNFIRWIREINTVVSRGQSNHIDGVRIMTVHGSKGLQAPVVILADTVRVPSAFDPLLLNEAGELIYLPSATHRPNALQPLYEEAYAAMIAEYYRLLYVAMTRAEDELIVCGWKSKKNTNFEISWYNQIHTQIGKIGTRDDNDVIILGGNVTYGACITKTHHPGIALPAYFDASPPFEPPAPPVLSPSQLTRPLFVQPAFAQNMSQSSQSQGISAKEKGIRLHRLFELWHHLDDTAKRTCAPPDEVAQVARIWSDERFTRFFVASHYAEVELRGSIDNNPIVAIIDRVGVDEQGVWFLDFKTTQKPTDAPDDLPAYILGQMGCYADLLANLYPTKQIQGYILWTQNSTLTEVPIVKAKEVFRDLLRAGTLPQRVQNEEQSTDIGS